jgi:hypothetical protein
MRITLEIDEEKIERIMKLTKNKKKSPALAAALDEFIIQKHRQEVVAQIMANESGYETSNEEIETLAHKEP